MCLYQLAFTNKFNMSKSAVSKGKKRKTDSGVEVWFIPWFTCIV